MFHVKLSAVVGWRWARAEGDLLGADGGAKGVCQGLAKTLDVGFMFGFDHNAGELLGTRIPKNDAAVFAKSRLRLGERAGDFGERIERWLGAHLYVDDLLRVVFQAFDE